MKTKKEIESKLERIKVEHERNFTSIKRRIMLYCSVDKAEWENIDKLREQISYLEWVLD